VRRGQSARLRIGHDGLRTGRHWCAPPSSADDRVLARARQPVLDIGCGPGRHVLALAERGTVALGIDLTPGAVAWARRGGAPVLERSVFHRIPGHGRWRTALLLDGNVGIGGDPHALLQRIGTLLSADGVILVELEPATTGSRPPVGCTAASLELDGVPGPWFPWTEVGADEIRPIAAGAGFAVIDEWHESGRHFAELRRPP
jgi:SAM-dependent methyltransferase